jgi:hypothetical protein
VQVIDADEQRLARAEVGRRRVHPVERREGEVAAGPFVMRARRIQHRHRRPCCAGEDVGALGRGKGRQDGLEQLSHDPVGTLVLQLDAARTEDLQTGGGGAPPRLREEARLSDAGRPLDEDEPPAVGGVVEESVEYGKLGVPFVQLA